MAITRFRDQYFFLSSMSGLKVPIETPDGPAFAVENAYQASKFTDPDIRKLILNAKDGFKAKQLSRRREHQGYEVRTDWAEVKDDIMAKLQREKFDRNRNLARKLLMTGTEPIIELNTKDDYWGVTPDNPDSQNKLGFILEDIRADLAEAEGINGVPHSSKPLTQS